MAIVNRTLDASEQLRVFEAHYGLTGTGLVLNAAVIPYPCTLDAIRVTAKGLSGAPTIVFKVDRFIVGTGLTTITGGATTLTVGAIGTSGIQSVVLAAAGSTFLSLQANDVVTLTTGAANTAVDALSVAVVVQSIQDIKSTFGLTS